MALVARWSGCDNPPAKCPSMSLPSRPTVQEGVELGESGRERATNNADFTVTFRVNPVVDEEIGAFDTALSVGRRLWPGEPVRPKVVLP